MMINQFPALMWVLPLAFFGAWALCGWLVRYLGAHGRLDLPNERSSHVTPTPRGGGIAFLSVFIPLAIVTGFDAIAAWSIAVLALVSYVDDRNALSWQVRLCVQCLAVGTALAGLWASGFLPVFYQPFSLLPLVVFVAAIGFLWIWHINVANFMDGADGYAALKALFMLAGIAAYSFYGSENPALVFHVLLFAAALGGFLLWNLPPAKIFMGDVGSIPLGFITGYFLLQLVGSGAWGLPLALALWCWADAALTITLRLYKKQPILQAHREHLYQRAMGQAGQGHARLLKTFVLFQMINLAALAAVVVAFPQSQMLLMAVSLGVGAVYFYVLVRMARQN